MNLTMTEAGHKVVAMAMKKLEYYLGVGGLPENYPTPWSVNEEPPPFDPNSTALLYPYGYRKVSRVEYVYEDPNGLLIVGDKRYSVSEEPTRQIYLEFLLDSEDAAEKTIYQMGIFVNLQKKPDVPDGKLFLLPQDVENTGTLYMGENIRPVYKQEGIREIYTVILTC